MTTKRTFSRSFATLSAMFMLATGVALTAAPSTARAESAAFDVFTDDGDDSAFMDYTDDLGVSEKTVMVAGSAAGATSGAGVKAPAAGALTPMKKPTVNIIMKDGNVCDPIRHMGC